MTAAAVVTLSSGTARVSVCPERGGTITAGGISAPGVAP